MNIKYLFLSRARGFTLVEMAVVLVIVAILIGGLLVPIDAQIKLRDYRESKVRLEQIREALYGYAIINGRLPCPTSTTDPADNVNYGHADGVCPFTSTAEILPWKDLGMPEVDSWGIPRSATAEPWIGYWRYRVDPAFTVNFTLSTPANNIDVQKSDGTSQTTASERAVAVICSTGKDKVANGENADFETASPVYQDDAQSPVFDDMCIWITRPSLVNRMVTAGRLP